MIGRTLSSAPDAVRFDQRRAAAHERIGDRQAGEIIRLEKHLGQRPVPEFRQNETPEQSPWPPREPFMDGDNPKWP
jgi:hypothetical protein